MKRTRERTMDRQRNVDGCVESRSIQNRCAWNSADFMNEATNCERLGSSAKLRDVSVKVDRVSSSANDSRTGGNIVKYNMARLTVPSQFNVAVHGT